MSPVVGMNPGEKINPGVGWIQELDEYRSWMNTGVRLNPGTRMNTGVN